jgi:uncharacterized membrane protein (DUF2068 family)
MTEKVSDQKTSQVSVSAGRTPGILILAGLNIIIGIFAILAGVEGAITLVGGELTIVANLKLVAMAVGFIPVIAGIGLYNLKSWAWWLAVISAFVGILLNVITVVFDWSQLTFYVLPILVRLLILVYLRNPQIRSKFK